MWSILADNNESWVVKVTNVYQITGIAHIDDRKGDLLATLIPGKQQITKLSG